VEPSSGLAIALAAYEQRGRLAPLLRRLQLRIKHGHLKIVFFGAGGTGKTTLSHFLGGKLHTETLARRYRESLEVEEVRLQGDLTATMFVPPGQARRLDSWTRLYQELGAKGTIGIINVVSWGLHSFERLSFEETATYQTGMTVDDFISAWRLERQQAEIRLLETLEPRIIDAPGSVWMVTFVAKEDLWWNDRVLVRTHYEDADYAEILKRIEQQRGASRFRHEYASAAVVMQNLLSGTDQLLMPTVAGYDDELRYGRLRRVVEIVDSLARRK
jgi:energy-coupling factor transporter ATP-binding protein EcfA2